jgi:hypothetical protein
LCVNNKMPTTNPLLNPRLKSDRYESRKEERRKKAEATRRLLCSIVLSEKSHDLLQRFALDNNLTYSAAVAKAVSHCQNCFAQVPEEQDEE